ncbi:hypothetical protein [Photobacterium phosphoreum]|uniref:hypothetical protein n=1 Tax=Photobacterium phosphoreum TaxID=659 RepID=UPI001E47E1EE|nr:hypothetical protein [Photobacterium phosphoreum]MCD9480096.1 hypothetical protein [Photobacterium phosphoreum]
MRKLDEYSQIDENNNELNKIGESIHELVELLDEKLKTLLQETTNENGDNLAELLSQFEDKKESIKEVACDAVGEMEAYYDDRTEKWQSSFRGECFNEWRSAWGDALNTFEEIEVEVFWNTEFQDKGMVTIDSGIPEKFELPSESPEY